MEDKVVGRASGHWVRQRHLRIVPAAVRVSGRRLVVEYLYYACLMNTLPHLYRLGVLPSTLARLYGHVR